MRLFSFLLAFGLSSLAATKEVAEYHRLPGLREQVAIQDAWTEERIENVPNILQKYGVDAWLVSSSPQCEDTN